MGKMVAMEDFFEVQEVAERHHGLNGSKKPLARHVTLPKVGSKRQKTGKLPNLPILAPRDLI